MNKAHHASLIALKNPSRLMSILARRAGLSADTGKRFGTAAEMDALMRYAGGAKLGIVEIGVLDGCTTREMALVAKVPIFGIDPLIPDSMDVNLSGSEAIIRKNLSFYKKFTLLKDYSFNLARSFKDPFDFIFIDGDHSYEACLKDFEDWYPLTSNGGFIAFHDSAAVTSQPSAHKGYEGPIRVAEELKKDGRVRYVETVDSITVFQKA
jgi:Methyltransferase domain